MTQIKTNRDRELGAIHYYLPQTKVQSAGIRRIYRHTALLRESGFDAYILHDQKGFQRDDMAGVPTRNMEEHRLGENAIVVVPEGFPNVMASLKSQGVRCFAIALNWDYVFKNLPLGSDYDKLGVERAMVISPAIGRMIAWSMGLPVHVIASGINHQLYHYQSHVKQPQIAYIQRKGHGVDQLKRMLAVRNKDYVEKIRWIGMDGLTEARYAEEICRSSIFLNASLAEGYPTSCLEAMAAGTLVVSYDSLCSREILKGQGPDQNAIVVPNGDYLSFAYALAPVLDDLINNKMERWSPIISRGMKSTASITLARERDSLISFWRKVFSCT